MERLIMNPADQRRRNAAANNNSNVVDLTGDSPAGSGDHRHSMRRANDFGRMNGNLSHMMQRGNMADASNNNNSDNNQGHEDFEMPDGIDVEEARQLEVAMFGIAYEAPASRRPMNTADPLPFVVMNVSDEVLGRKTTIGDVKRQQLRRDGKGAARIRLEELLGDGNDFRKKCNDFVDWSTKSPEESESTTVSHNRYATPPKVVAVRYLSEVS